MADKNNSGDKTEKPTPKRLKDARKKGDVSKSKDITSTAIMILWIVLFAASLLYIIDRLAGLLTNTLIATGLPYNLSYAISNIGYDAFITLLQVSSLLVIPVVLFGLLVEFLQTGPIMTLEKIKPKMEHMNPASGIKRMFSIDNLVEVVKSIIKTILLFAIGWLVLQPFLPHLVKLPNSMSVYIGETLLDILLLLFLWTVGVFSIIAILDAGYQRFSYLKKLRMSMRDIKQEHKENEGDPLIKQQRRQAHQEWSQQSALSAARSANVLVVNPIHLAIALDYDRETIPVPTVSAKGEEHIARAMRDAAKEAYVPILRNEELARTLYTDIKEGDTVPNELFDIVAEVILWAKQVKQQIDGEPIDKSFESFEPPGEDLTLYPE
ncbi:MAG: type III secretion system export apparatus subunit SctU [Candidatus Thiodiazotropha sp.]|jgi:type III secretion YscU/HrpY family protein